MEKCKCYLLKRLIVSPFIYCIILISYIWAAIISPFHRTWLFILHGGEWINYKPQDRHTIQDIYEEVKRLTALDKTK